jgi:acetyl-CoA carboxylase biotin carboxyl carrier protein
MAKKSKQGPSGDLVGGVSLTEVERLLSFMQAHGLEEFEYEHGGVHIRLKKAGSAPASAQPSPVPQYNGYTIPEAPVAISNGAPSASAAPHGHATPPAPVEDLHIIKSPIVGTFYASPSPDAEAFVTVGSRVQAGQVLCIIEAMKLMNEIESDVAGEIARVLIENGHPVEYGEPLFGIRTSGKK